MINNRINENYVMKAFSTRRTYDLTPEGVPFGDIPNLPSFANFQVLKYLKYDFISKNEESVIIQITELFNDDFVSVPSTFGIGDQHQLITVPRTNTNANLPTSFVSFNGLFGNPISIQFLHVIPIETNEFVNKFLFINGAFRFAPSKVN